MSKDFLFNSYDYFWQVVQVQGDFFDDSDGILVFQDGNL